MPKSKEEIDRIRKEALETLAKYKADLEKFDHKIDEQEDRWQREIALLEKRVHTNIKEVEIGDKGETIAIRGSLSDYEVGKIIESYKLIQKLDQEKDKEVIDEITYTILAAITANPLMTPQFFKDNRRKYGTEDMLAVLFSFFELMSDRAKRVAEIQQFRKRI